MQNKIDDTNWKELVQKFQYYEGTIVSFCDLHNISKDRFYYYRKKYASAVTETTFHAIEVKTNTITATNIFDDILKLEIGKATLHIPNNVDENSLSSVMKVLVSIC